MKAKELTVGGKYLMKVSGNVVPVQLLEVREVFDLKGRSRTRYRCTNLKTGRACSASSPQKFRGVAKDEPPAEFLKRTESARQAAVLAEQRMVDADERLQAVAQTYWDARKSGKTHNEAADVAKVVANDPKWSVAAN